MKTDNRPKKKTAAGGGRVSGPVAALWMAVPALALLFLAHGNAALAAAAKEKKTEAAAAARFETAAEFESELRRLVGEKGGVFLYLYASSYSSSAEELGRIRRLAATEGAGFIAVDVYAEGMDKVYADYEVTHVPTVLHIKKNFGIVENFAGPKEVAGLTAKRKKFHVNDYHRKIEANAKAGKVTLLEFFAGWCDPCLEQMPVLEKAEKMAGGKLDVLKLDLDKTGEMISLYNIQGPPTNIILDARGVPVQRFRRATTPSEIIYFLEEKGML